MRRLFVIGLVALLGLVIVTSASAQKFGYLDSQALLAELPEVKQAESNLEALKTQLEKKYRLEVEEFQKKVSTYQANVQEGKLSPVQQETEGKKLQEDEQALLKQQNELAGQLDAKRQEQLKPIYERVNKALEDVAKENSFQFIFDKAVLLYSDPANDVVALVKAKLAASN